MQDDTEALVESIVKEKWDDLVGDVGDLAIWKESVKNDLASVKQELLRFENRFDSLQRSIIGKVHDYNKGIKDIGSDIRALDNVLQKIITPLSTNIRELNKFFGKRKLPQAKISNRLDRHDYQQSVVEFFPDEFMANKIPFAENFHDDELIKITEEKIYLDDYTLLNEYL